MKDKDNVAEVKLAKILLKKNQEKEEKKKTKPDQSLDDIINNLPPKYLKKFREEYPVSSPSRRDIDHFLRKYNLVKKS